MSSFFSSNQRSTDSTISESDRSLAPSSNKFEFHQGAMTKFYGRAVVISRNDKTYNDTLTWCYRFWKNGSLCATDSGTT
jgi:hypothetical protein